VRQVLGAGHGGPGESGGAAVDAGRAAGLDCLKIGRHRRGTHLLCINLALSMHIQALHLWGRVGLVSHQSSARLSCRVGRKRTATSVCTPHLPLKHHPKQHAADRAERAARQRVSVSLVLADNVGARR